MIWYDIDDQRDHEEDGKDCRYQESSLLGEKVKTIRITSPPEPN